VALLDKLSVKAAERTQLSLAAQPVVDPPQVVDARAVEGERGKRLLSEALTAAASLAPDQSVDKFRLVAQSAPSARRTSISGGARSRGAWLEAEQAYRAAAASGSGALAYQAAARAAALAAARGDAAAARESVSLARSALGDPPFARVAAGEHRAGLGETLRRRKRWSSPCLPRPRTTPVPSARWRGRSLRKDNAAWPGSSPRAAAQADDSDPDPVLVKAAIARASGEPARGDRGPARGGRGGCGLVLAPSSPSAAHSTSGGRRSSAGRDPRGPSGSIHRPYGAVLAYGQARRANQGKPAEQALARAIALSPRAAEPHFELARLKLDGDGDAQAALTEAKTFPQPEQPAAAPGPPDPLPWCSAARRR